MTSLQEWAPGRESHPARPDATLRGREAEMLRLLEQVNKSGKMRGMPRSRVSPVGAAVANDIRRHEKADAQYRKVRARFARAEAVARLLIQLRMKHNLTQEQLAQLMGTSAPAISRLESGTHVPSLTTLSRLAEAAGERLVIGFERANAASRKGDRTLIAV
jgi:DNA-binding XRE family transcriptional regulator